MSAMRANLQVADGEGFMRDQTGGSYDSQEWVFVDLRAARAFALGGSATFSASLFAWNTQQSADNFGEISELYSPTTGDYEGSPPMVGFGAGAYILTLRERGTTLTPSCGAFAAEPGFTDDGGVVAGNDAGADAGTSAGVDAGPSPSDGGSGGGDATVGGGDDAGGPAGPPPGENGGAGAGSSSSGCDCAAAGAPRAPTWAWVAGLLLLAFARRARSCAPARSVRGSTP
jgi:MYXO-CTERM domain-containing protein